MAWKNRRLASRIKRALSLGGLAFAGMFAAQTVHAAEGGASLYLLGTGGPGAAILPPLEGVFFDNMAYYYEGVIGGGKQFDLGGNLVAGVKARVPADFVTGLWTPSTNFLGGTLGVGAIVPFGDPQVSVNAVITGPRGRSVVAETSDRAWVIGDPVLLGELGWTRGDYHWTVSNLLNIPVGQYRDGDLANLSFHRWADDVSLAGTWHDNTSGWDVSAKAGFTFNGTNEATDYTTGTEFHLEGAIEKSLSKAFSVGVQAYYYDQVSGDSGPGAILGPFKGQVTGVGGTGAYNFMIGKAPISLRLRAMTEMNAKNRLEGNSFWLDISLPLWAKLPPGAGG